MVWRKLGASAGAGIIGGAAYLRYTYPRWPDLPGPSRVHSLQYRVPGGVDAQIFYPADAPALQPVLRRDQGVVAPYARDEAIDGLARWTGRPLWFLSFLLQDRAPPLTAPSAASPPPVYEACRAQAAASTASDDTPVLVFSHGLGGSYEQYSALCSAIASFGVIVVALEHDDGSGSFALRAPDGPPVFYTKVPADLDYTTRSNVVDFRAPFLRRRLADIAAVCKHREALAARSGAAAARGGSEGDDERARIALAEALLGGAGATLLAGHSFGGATAYLAVQEAARGGAGGLFAAPFAGCLLMDFWPYPLPEEAVQEGLAPSVTPTLIMQSQQFVENDENPLTQRIVANSRTGTEADRALLPVFLGGSRHQSWADAVFWLPEELVRGLRIAGQAPVADVFSTIVAGSVRWLQSCVDADRAAALEQARRDIAEMPHVEPLPEDAAARAR